MELMIKLGVMLIILDFGLVPSSLPFRLMRSLKHHSFPSVTAYLLLPES